MNRDKETDDVESQPLLARANDAVTSTEPGATRPLSCLQRAYQSGRKIKLEVLAMYLSLGDPQCGWKARFMTVVVLCYAFSPFDWIPQLIPAMALIVDFIILPMLLWLTRKAMKPEVLVRARIKAATHELTMAHDWKLMLLAYGLWVLNVVLCIRLVARHISKDSYIYVHEYKLMVVGALVVSILFSILTWWRLHVETWSPQRKAQHDLSEPILPHPEEGADTGARTVSTQW